MIMNMVIGQNTKRGGVKSLNEQINKFEAVIVMSLVSVWERRSKSAKTITEINNNME